MIVLCGRSCSGKDSVKKALLKKGYNSVVRYTTRPMRDGEVDGVTYHFVTEDEMSRMMLERKFVEVEWYKVADGSIWYYGTAWDDMRCNSVLIMNPVNVWKVKAVLDINPVVFYLHSSRNVLRSRSIERGDERAEAERRMLADDNDFSDIVDKADFVIRNDGDFIPEAIARMVDKLYQMAIGLKNINKTQEDFA